MENRTQKGSGSQGSQQGSQRGSGSDRNAEHGKDPSRVEAGKKAAETRGHESLSEAGRKGGEASHRGSGSRREEED